MNVPLVLEIHCLLKVLSILPTPRTKSNDNLCFNLTTSYMNIITLVLLHVAPLSRNNLNWISVCISFFSDFSILVWVYFYTYYFHSFSFLNFYSWEDHCFLRAKNSAATHSFSLFVDDWIWKPSILLIPGMIETKMLIVYFVSALLSIIDTRLSGSSDS